MFHLGSYYTYLPASAYVQFIDNVLTQDVWAFYIDSYSGDLGKFIRFIFLINPEFVNLLSNWQNSNKL